ncbi:ABC transporter substrate-binding protein [Deinococcus radiophilus]|uniref:ABC transporter substrate-binding protein n=1 Tax=Deinococcus radiophilus TaxID=32062 RepID=A0A3S0I8A0_9DEIO|nr:ABC transporter substrate-binding protein [Deinococcus radiophilus]RTR27039.1 ABC transporter substrate-binding protein [Deinococcus radiophilus]UFA50178.1 ABC transporter substrate-binding protein [Deinococcus radiophilus]
MNTAPLSRLPLLALTATLLAGCAPQDDALQTTQTPATTTETDNAPADTTQAQNAAEAGTVTVGSKIDTEGALLCQITKLSLIDAGFTVNDKCSTGATNVVRAALEQGEIDLYPEYTGSAIYILNEAGATIDDAVSRDAEQAYTTVKELDAENGIIWLDRAPANNTWAVAVPQALAEENSLATMADFARWVNDGGAVKLAASQEFVDRDDALKAFEATYGFELTPEQLVIVPGGNTTQTETAAAQGTSGVNAAMAYGTDGAIGALGLVALTDPEGAVAVYQPALTVREETLNKFPQIADIMNPIFAGLNETTLAELNGRIAVNGEDAAKVAQDWLSQQ